MGCSSGSRPDEYRDARLHIDYQSSSVRLDGHPLRLTRTEFHLLAYLVRNADRVVTHDELLAQVWGGAAESFASVKQYISRLRRKLQQNGAEPGLVVTKRGLGYRYCPAG